MRTAPRVAALVSLVSLAFGLGPPPARADDAEAHKLLLEAYSHWRDPEPAKSLELATKALAAKPTGKAVKTSIQLFLVSLHQVKTGRLEEALVLCDEIAAQIPDAETDAKLRTTLADSLVRKANIIYGEKDDAAAALELYGRAQSLQPLSSTADAASQLCLRVGRSKSTPEEQRQEKLDLALALARDSIELVNVQYQRAEKRAQVRTKCLLQLAIVHLARKETDDAEGTWRELDEKLLDDNCQYQLCVWWALQGELERSKAAAQRSLDLRPTGLTRNQLRKFMRSEPDLAPLLPREDWKAIATDEDPAAGPVVKPEEKPAERPMTTEMPGEKPATTETPATEKKPPAAEKKPPG